MVHRTIRITAMVGLLAAVSGCATGAGEKPWWTLREANFIQLQAGKSTQAEVRAALGPPIADMHFQNQGETVWDYRYPDGAVWMLAWVYFDNRGVYRYFTVQPDPAEIYGEGM